jgi:hypothetical protein
VALKLLAPVRGMAKRRALRSARRHADEEILATRLPSPRLAWRTEELLAESNRLELGRSITSVVHSADERLLPNATPLNRPAVRENRPQLLELAALLCDVGRTVTPRGVLLVEHLLVDGTGPLYGRADPTRLRTAIRGCSDALLGRDDAAH